MLRALRALRGGSVAVIGLAAATLGACSGFGRGAVTVVNGTAHADTLVLRPFFRELRSVHGKIGADTGSWLFDTDGGITLVTPDIASRAGCRPYGRASGRRMTGETIVFQWCSNLDLRFGSRAPALGRVAVFDVNALLPQPLRSLSGVLSLDAFAGRVVTIDLPRSQIIVSDAPPAGPDRFAAPIRLATGDDGGSLTAFVRLDGTKGPLWFLLDSGDLEATLVGSVTMSQNLIRVAHDSTIEAPAQGGPIRLRVHSKPLIYDGVLGAEYLIRASPVVVDLRRRW